MFSPEPANRAPGSPTDGERSLKTPGNIKILLPVDNPGAGKGTLVSMNITRTATAFASLMLACSLSAPGIAQTAGQDMHSAGTDTKAAATNTGPRRQAHDQKDLP